MNYLKVLCRKIRRLFLQKENTFLLKRIDSNVNVGLLSCDKWKNHVYDDLLLQKAFLKKGIKAEIISWQDRNNRLENYNALLITSMWGYQSYFEDLTLWLKKAKSLKIFNNIELIEKNYDKTAQIDILKKNNLPIIPTTIIKKNELKGNEKFGDFPVVIKPSVSSGGENTFLANGPSELKKINHILKDINHYCDIIIQPFLPEIHNGEISIIVIDKKIVNMVIRFPGILDNVGQYVVKPAKIEEMDDRLKELCKNIISLKEYDKQLYMRIDVVKRDEKYMIMEVELFEPQLFYYLLKGKKRKDMLNYMVSAVKKRL